jgi:sigma-B regulation protein RsbU (phosphoserine phosphatase)
MFSKSIALRIFGLYLFFIVLPVTILFLIFTKWEYDEKINYDIHRIKNIGLSRAAYLNGFIADQYTALDIISLLTDQKNPEATSQFSRLLAPLALDKIYPSIGLLTRTEGDHFVVKFTSETQKQDLGHDLTYRGYIQPAIKNGYSSYLGYDDVTLAKEFIFSKAIRSRENYDLLSILILIVDANPILETLIEDEFFTETESVSLLTSDKIVFASSVPSLELTALDNLTEEELNKLQLDKQFGKLTVPRKTIHLTPFSNLQDVYQWSDNGRDHISFLAPIAGKSLYIWMDVEKKTISAPYIKATWITIAILFSITLASCFITIFISHLLSRTFAELINMMDKIGKGDLSARFQQKPFGFEINEAGLTLNTVIDSVVKNTEIANSEQLKTELASRELRIGRQIQESLTPRSIPDSGALEIGIFSKPAGDVSGNFYDIYTHNNHLIIALNDTSGTGLSSCLYSVCLRGILRSLISDSTDMGGLLEKANRLFHKDLQNAPLNVKTFIGSWDKETSTLYYASASPSFGFIKRANGPFDTLAGSRGSMGALPETTFQTTSVALQPGDILVLYTGGVIERQDPTGLLYGENGLKSVLLQKAHLGAPELAKAFENALILFTKDAVQEEDMTLIILKIKEDAPHV